MFLTSTREIDWLTALFFYVALDVAWATSPIMSLQDLALSLQWLNKVGRIICSFTWANLVSTFCYVGTSHIGLRRSLSRFVGCCYCASPSPHITPCSRSRTQWLAGRASGENTSRVRTRMLRQSRIGSFSRDRWSFQPSRFAKPLRGDWRQVNGWMEWGMFEWLLHETQKGLRATSSTS